MIPARRKQLSLNFTTLLILSLFPYRTWDLHGIQPLPYTHLPTGVCLKTTTTTYQTNTNQHQPTAPLQQHHWQTCSPSPPSSPPPASSSQPPTPSNSPIRAAQSVPPTIKLLPLAASTSFLSSLFPPSPHITQIPLTPPFFSFPSRRFGSCYDFCAESRKEFPVPECNGVSDEVLICEYFKSDCGELYGGCYSNKGPIPGWAVPTCPPASDPSKPEPQTAPKQDPTCQICVDNINDCGA